MVFCDVLFDLVVMGVVVVLSVVWVCLLVLFDDLFSVIVCCVYVCLVSVCVLSVGLACFVICSCCSCLFFVGFYLSCMLVGCLIGYVSLLVCCCF